MESQVFRIILPLLFLASLTLPIPSKASGNGYHWPMEAPPALTSTFGEYRSGRFHAGLDLKTWGREGYPVLAIDDGYVWRVRTSPWGYGKVVYLKLRDGRTAVYAHLSGFAHEIGGIVEQEQVRRGAYSVNLYLKAGQIPVRQGDVIGHSGSSGSGLPHLHFEIRDADQRPLNALSAGLSVKDEIAPTIRTLAFVPLEATARVDGRSAPRLAAVRYDSKAQRYDFEGSITLEGQIGVAVDVYDRADASALTNRLAPYRLTLSVDGEEIFETTYDQLDYTRIFQADLDRNYRLHQTGRGLFHNLHRSHGNDLPIYGGYTVGDGVLHAGPTGARRGAALSPGKHVVTVTAEDVYGNRSSALARVNVAVEPKVAVTAVAVAGDSVRVDAVADGFRGSTLTLELAASEDNGATWATLSRAEKPSGSKAVFRALHKNSVLYRFSATDGPSMGQVTFAPVQIFTGTSLAGALSTAFEAGPDAARIDIRSDRVLAGPPIVEVVRTSGRLLLSTRQLGLMEYETVLPFSPRDDAAEVSVSALDLDGNALRAAFRIVQQRVSTNGGLVASADGLAQASFEPESTYSTFYGRAAARSEPGTTSDDLRPVTRAYDFSPADVPFRRPAILSLAYPHGAVNPERLGVYEWKDDSGWAFVGNRIDVESGRVAAEIRHFSTYALLADLEPPEVSRLTPGSGETTRESRPELTAMVLDSQSGIGREEDVEIRVDDVAQIVEYDPEADLIRARPHEALKEGLHSFEVRVRDMSGNETRVVSQFEVGRRR